MRDERIACIITVVPSDKLGWDYTLVTWFGSDQRKEFMRMHYLITRCLLARIYDQAKHQ